MSSANLAMNSSSTAQKRTATVTIDEAAVIGTLDLSRYSLGQGGLSPKSIMAEHLKDLTALRPRYLRFFIQEYYGLYPDHNTYHWDTFDSSMADIVATGAEPIPSICFKPRVLFPTVDQRITDPNSYAEWAELVYQLVTHCLQMGFGIHHWEIGNEPDAGEPGGCPYLFTPDGYVRYYAHTAAAILHADPTAKIGGPALGSFNQNNAIGTALITAAAAGDVPLDFYSWHGYSDDAAAFCGAVNDVKAKLAPHPRLSHVETMITEWNFDLGQTHPPLEFQPAFILEATRHFRQAGLSAAHYYHIRDTVVDEEVFSQFMSAQGASNMANWWNNRPQNLGIYGNQGAMRPAYYSFLLLSRLVGPELAVEASTADIRGFAVRTSDSLRAVLWNYGEGTTYNTSITLPSTACGSLRLSRLDAAGMAMKIVLQGGVSDLAATRPSILLPPYGILLLEVTRQGSQ